MTTKDAKMAEIVTYESSGEIARICIDDGKRNVMTDHMLASLHQALDQAEQQARAVVLSGREGIFSAGFDLQVFARGDPEEIYGMMRLGAELALRVFSFPLPVVVACTGHAYPMGAFLMMAADYSLGADGAFRIGLNEVAIGIAVPVFAVELARATLAANYADRILTGDLLDPREALAAGYFDRLVREGDLHEAAETKARAFAALAPAAYRLTKSRVRAAAADRIRQAIDMEITIDNYRRLLALRDETR